MIDIEKQELQSCPFCGGEARNYIDEDDDYQPSICCKNCYCSIKASETKEDAIITWNTRVESAELLSARERIRILNRGINLLEWVHRKYADKNLSFDDNWFAEVQDYFMHDYEAKEALKGKDNESN